MKPTYLLLLGMLCAGALQAQIELKTEYIGMSPFRDGDNRKIEGAEGKAIIHQASFMIPLSMKMNDDEKPTMWGIAGSGMFTRLDNKNIPASFTPEDIMNLDLALIYMRPMNKKWSVMAMLGAGVYSPHVRLSRIRKGEVLANGGAIFVCHLRPNLDLGGGLMINNSFGYPMVFPGFVVRWRLEGRFEVEAQMMNAAELSAGYKTTSWLTLKVFGELSASGAFQKVDGKNMMFTHQYVNTGLRMVFLPGGGFSIPVTIGCTPYRATIYQERSLKAFFKDDGKDFDPHFSAAPYVSVSLRYGF